MPADSQPAAQSLDLLFSSSKHIENSIQRGEPSVHQGESAAKQEEQQQEEFQAHVAYWDPFIPDIVAPAQQIAKNRMLGKSSEEVHTIVRLMEKVVSAKVRNQLAADAAAEAGKVPGRAAFEGQSRVSSSRNNRWKRCSKKPRHGGNPLQKRNRPAYRLKPRPATGRAQGGIDWFEGARSGHAHRAARQGRQLPARRSCG